MNVNIYIYHFERLSHFSQCLPAIAVAIGTATTIVAPLVRMHLTGRERDSSGVLCKRLPKSYLGKDYTDE